MSRFLFSLAAILALTSSIVAADKPRIAQRWAVLIGVDDYTYAEDLSYCGADQTALRDRLRSAGFPDDNIFLLHDKATDARYKPSKGNIERQLNVVLNLAEANDLLVVGFSGHGVSLAGKSYLCPSDATLDDSTTLVALDGLYDRLNNCAANFKLMLVDACRNDPHVGATRSFTASEGTKQLARSLQEIKLPEGVVLLNSCAPGEVSREEADFGHGVYMHFILEALAGAADANADGAVSLHELQSYAGLKTKTYVARKYSDSQRPFYRSEGESDLMEFALLPVGRNSPPSIVSVPSSPAITPATPNNTPAPALPVPANLQSTTNSVGMRLILIPAGEFMMGSPANETFGAIDEKPQHRVRITKPFYLGQTEVTQGQWESVIGTTPWKGFKRHVLETTQSEIGSVKEGADYAATYVSYNDASDFCKKLSEKEGKSYRLPTEAEWEYSCRAGTTTKFHFGDEEGSLSEYAWWGGYRGGNCESERFAHQVGRKRQNAWGLYDMHGNVEEWCYDGYDGEFYKNARVDDPWVAGAEDSVRVHRGGSWFNVPSDSRSARRLYEGPRARENSLGFRVVLVP